MFRLYRVRAYLVTRLGALVEDEHMCRARSADDAMLQALKIFTEFGEEILEVEASICR